MAKQFTGCVVVDGRITEVVDSDGVNQAELLVDLTDAELLANGIDTETSNEN